MSLLLINEWVFVSVFFFLEDDEKSEYIMLHVSKKLDLAFVLYKCTPLSEEVSNHLDQWVMHGFESVFCVNKQEFSLLSALRIFRYWVCEETHGLHVGIYKKIKKAQKEIVDFYYLLFEVILL